MNRKFSKSLMTREYDRVVTKSQNHYKCTFYGVETLTVSR